MKTIIKKAKHLAEILGITERAVTIRADKIKIKECVLNNEVLKGDLCIEDFERIISEENDKRLAGFTCHIDVYGDNFQYTFYKNV